MSVQIAKPELKEIVDSIDGVASLPDVTVRIIQAADDPRADAFRLLKIVSNDPTLVARILKLVNSSFYGLSSPVASLTQAIALLGMQTVRNLAVASGVATMFRGGELCDGFRAQDLWTHSIAVAVAARELASPLRLPATDDPFLIGMLHDLGLLVMHERFPDALRKICDDSRTQGRDFCELEQEEFGFDHVQLAGAMSRLWRFPDSIRVAIEFHHQPETAPPQHRRLASLIHVADTLSCQPQQGGFNLTGCGQIIDDDVLAAIPLSRDRITEIQENLPQLVARMSPFTS